MIVIYDHFRIIFFYKELTYGTDTIIIVHLATQEGCEFTNLKYFMLIIVLYIDIVRQMCRAKPESSENIFFLYVILTYYGSKPSTFFILCCMTHFPFPSCSLSYQSSSHSWHINNLLLSHQEQ